MLWKNSLALTPDTNPSALVVHALRIRACVHACVYYMYVDVHARTIYGQMRTFTDC